MTLLRAPTQFSPRVSGGPVTPSCCGCCCCCCCVGTAVAASIAMPVLASQLSHDRSIPATPTFPTAAPTPRRNRPLGILLAALALPVGVLIPFLVEVFVAVDAPVVLAVGVVVALAMAIGGYLMAGVGKVAAVIIPVLVLAVGSALFVGELLLWIKGLVDDDASPIALVALVCMVIGLPVATIVVLIMVGRRRRSGRHPQAAGG